MAARRTLLLLAVLALVVVCSARSLQTNDKRKAPKNPKPSLPKEPKPTNIKPTNTKPTKVVKEPSKDEKVPMTTDKKNVTYDSLTDPQKMCVDKYMGWYTVETLKPYEQCGGKGAECASYGSEELHCLDAPFYDHECPKDYTCERQDPSEGMYYQCVEDKENGNKDKDKEEEEVMVEERVAADKNITIKDKEEGWEKLSSTKKEEIGAKCLGWPVEGAKKMLRPYEMCGGTAPQACSEYGPCKDEPFPEYECPEDYECTKLNMYWWMCQPM